MEVISEQSCQGFGVYRFLRGADREKQGAVRFGGPCTSPSQGLHFNVTEHPTAWWTGQQIIEAFPWDTVPKYLLRDRDAIYGNQFQQRVQSMGIEEVLTAPRSP